MTEGRARALSEVKGMQDGTEEDGGHQADGGHTGDGDGRSDPRLMERLRRLVRDEGRMDAAEMLGVNYKTLVRSLDSGRISRRMADAVERLLGPGEDGSSVMSRQRERIEALENRTGDLEGRIGQVDQAVRGEIEEVRAALEQARTTLEGEVRRLRDEHGRGFRALADRVGRAEAAVASSMSALTGARRLNRDLDPLVVTEEPADDDEDVYGAAWPAVAEWRRLRTGHPHSGRTVPWLAAEEEILTLELVLLEDFGLTLPPEREPLRGFGRNGQINWRRTALGDTRRSLARRRRLLRVRRIISLGLWLP